jgi:hypothetical protein
MMSFYILTNRDIYSNFLHCIEILVQSMSYLEDLSEASLPKRSKNFKRFLASILFEV